VLSVVDSLTVLVADDQPDVLQAIRLLLKGAGHKAETVESPAALLAAAAGSAFDVILMDMNYARDTTSGAEGLEVVRALRARHDETPIIVMTAWGSVDLAVEAMRRGASDFVQKPWDNERLLASITEQATRGRAVLRAREEIEIARNVQRKLLPQRTKAMATIEYAGCCVPAREVGGDYYDFIDYGPGSLGLVLADVSGKGVGAALLMANLQALFRTHTNLATINRMFMESTPPEQYATAFVATYDEVSRCLRYVNCGHPPALLRRGGGEVEALESTTTVLGLFEDVEFAERTVRLHPGDTLVMCSDGVFEAEGCGEAEVAGLIGGGPAEELVERIAARACNQGQEDDVTAVVVRGR
jgi:sigma-B regulation protein RsbU (phosphoserine phosphatase)